MTEPAHPATVLVVDDEALIRLVAADILESVGLHVLEAEDGAHALRIIEEHPEVGVLFSDVNMPGELDGIGLATEVYRRWPAIKLLITSGRERLIDASLPDHGSFLPKPYNAAQLLDAVHKKLMP